MSLQTYVFVDHSNIEFSAQKASGESQEFLNRPEKSGKKIVRLNDTRCTVQPKEIWTFLETQQGQSITKMYCYTSDSTLTEHGRQGRRDVLIRHFPNYNRREKTVDTYLVADAVELIVKEAPGVISLWTGDADIITPVVDKAKNYGWRVDLWAFKGSRSNVIKENPEVISHTKELEECYQHFTETKFGWKPNPEKTPKSEESFQLRFEKEEWDIVKEDWKKLVEDVSKRVKLPLQGWMGKELLHLVLAVPGEDLAWFMKGVWADQGHLQEKIRSFIEIKMGVRESTCRLIIQATGGGNATNHGPSRGLLSGHDYGPPPRENSPGRNFTRGNTTYGQPRGTAAHNGNPRGRGNSTNRGHPRGNAAHQAPPRDTTRYDGPQMGNAAHQAPPRDTTRYDGPQMGNAAHQGPPRDTTRYDGPARGNAPEPKENGQGAKGYEKFNFDSYPKSQALSPPMGNNSGLSTPMGNTVGQSPPRESIPEPRENAEDPEKFNFDSYFQSLRSRLGQNASQSQN